MKELIAYSSVAHGASVPVSLPTNRVWTARNLQMISHGFIAGALFLCVLRNL
jgi:NADH:ubiquinone oxidoreductase subunit 4 (subunit M)